MTPTIKRSGSWAILAEFIGDVHLERHIGKLRRVYEERWRALLDELAKRPTDRIQTMPGASGFQLTVRLRPGLDDRRVAARA